MSDWRQELRFDPLGPLLSYGSEALEFHARRDLMDERAGSFRRLWRLPEPVKMLRRQREDGSWRYPGKSQPYNNFALLETFRNIGFLVEMYSFNRRQAATQAAAEYIFSCQTGEGDIRGFLGNQYMPYYHGAIVELLIKAGYAGDPRTHHALDWLLSLRQADGGWIIPVQAVPASAKTESLWRGKPVAPDRTLPFSHLATGMALRGLAAHPRYRRRRDVQAAAALLKTRFFQADAYNDRRAPAYWTKFQFPYWWTDLVSGLDILSRTGFSSTDPDVQRALAWFLTHQESDGLWPTGYDKGSQALARRAWVGLAICRVLRRFL